MTAAPDRTGPSPAPAPAAGHSTVLVAGAGIGGLALGIGLRLAGVDAVLVERTPAGADTDVGAGLVLYPNGMRALEAIDPALRDTVLAAGHAARPGETRPLLNPAGELLSLDPVGELGTRYGLPQVSLLRSTLQAALRRRAGALGLPVLAGTTVTGHRDRGDRVEATLSNGAVRTADILVGADGLNSGVRARTLADGPPRYCGYTTLRGRSGPCAPYPGGYIVSNPGLALFVAPTGEGDLYWTAKIAAAAGRWPARGPHRCLRDLREAVTDWHPPLAAVLHSVKAHDKVLVTDVNDREPTPHWTHHRVTLLGDAAHPMSPGAGQGACMALEDAAVLSGLLGAAPHRGDLPRALADYARARSGRAAAAVRLSHRRDTVVQEQRPGRTDREFSTLDAQLTDLLGWRPDPAGPAHPVQQPSGKGGSS